MDTAREETAVAKTTRVLRCTDCGYKAEYDAASADEKAAASKALDKHKCGRKWK